VFYNIQQQIVKKTKILYVGFFDIFQETCALKIGAISYFGAMCTTRSNARTKGQILKKCRKN